MNISSAQNYSTQFKASYPVYHWVRESNGSYAPALSKALNEKLQRSVVRLLNGQGKNTKPEKLKIIQEVKAYIASRDKDFALNPQARSFYTSSKGLNNNKFEPYGYILTGKDAEAFTQNLGKPIGRAKGAVPKVNDRIKNSAEVNMAIGDYWNCGLRFVKSLASKFRDNNKIPYGLHTKFEVVRNKTGKIKELKLIDMKFCPEIGAENPFVRTGYIQA